MGPPLSQVALPGRLCAPCLSANTCISAAYVPRSGVAGSRIRLHSFCGIPVLQSDGASVHSSLQREDSSSSMTLSALGLSVFLKKCLMFY